MKNIFYLILLSCLFLACASSQWPSKRFIKKNKYQKVQGQTFGRGVDKPDVEAMYPGGSEGLTTHIIKNLKYPPIAVDNGIEGRVFVKFVINEDGYVSNIEVTQSVHPVLDNEAVRIIEQMDRWIPAYQNEEAVKVQFGIPINFKLID